MAKHATFPTRAKTAKRARSVFSSATFIQRSRHESSEQKAIWHQVTGAGRGHVMRPFFGLTDDEQIKAKGLLAVQIGRRLKAMSSEG
jgi:hypothetical protein